MSYFKIKVLREEAGPLLHQYLSALHQSRGFRRVVHTCQSESKYCLQTASWTDLCFPVQHLSKS